MYNIVESIHPSKLKYYAHWAHSVTLLDVRKQQSYHLKKTFNTPLSPSIQINNSFKASNTTQQNRSKNSINLLKVKGHFPLHLSKVLSLAKTLHQSSLFKNYKATF